MKRIILCAALVASACLAGANVAMAQDDELRVRVGDLDLKSDAGARAEFARIHAAAATFCSRDEGRTTLNRHLLGKACERRMTEKVVAALDEPLVTALYKKAHGTALASADAAPVLAAR